MKSRNLVIPQICHDFDIRISRDGTWFHMGNPIKRPELVRLFAGILKRDKEGGYWLETPFERGRIVVEDAPFVIVSLRIENSGPNQRLVFTTNTDEEITLSSQHPLRLVAQKGEAIPYIEMRNGLSARISRPVFYQLVDKAEAVPVNGKMEWQIHSDGYSASLGQTDEKS